MRISIARLRSRNPAAKSHAAAEKKAAGRLTRRKILPQISGAASDAHA
jgi:hypothetical protein